MNTRLSRKSFLQGSLGAAAAMLAGTHAAQAAPASTSAMAPSMPLTPGWDKTFPKSDKVEHRRSRSRTATASPWRATCTCRSSAAISGWPALAISGPFGAVKEQSSGLYAQTMAERGYVALAFDPSYTGESGGEPRNVASPDINTEDFSAAVDFLGLQPSVDRNRIGIIGICGFGGMGLNAAAVDKRIKAVVTTSMYDMSRVMARGYYDKLTNEQRAQMLEKMSQQRWTDAEKRLPRAGSADPARDARRHHRSGRADVLRLLPHAARLPRALAQLQRRVDGHDSAVVHEHAAADLHRGDRAAPDPADRWRECPLALLQRGRVQGRGRTEGADDHPRTPTTSISTTAWTRSRSTESRRSSTTTWALSAQSRL